MSDQKYVIMIHNREYSSWNFLTSDAYFPIEINADFKCDPAKHKLFSRDIIYWPEGSETCPQISYSPTRNQLISAVLELESGRTYGRNATGKKLMYRCIPNDRYLPSFLVPYSPKTEFHKKMENKFVLIRFNEWTKQHPIAQIEQVLGSTSDLNAFYEYQLYSRSLITNDGFSDFKRLATNIFNVRESHCRAVNSTIEQEIINNPHYRIADCTKMDDKIFTIDPRNSSDFDDGFSVKRCPTSPHIICVSIYISSVYVWINQLDLWASFGARVSTIYLPDYRRPMIPALLSEQLCSLVADGKPKFAVRWNIQINTKTKKILEESTFEHVAVQIDKNYCYDSPELEKNKGFQLLREATAVIDEKEITDSHDIVAFWMVKMNAEIGRILATKHNTGIFRRAKYNNQEQSNKIDSDIPIEINADVRRLIRGWKNSTGVYTLYNEELTHEFLETEYYVHATSPIRRIVDLLNQIVFLEKEIGIKISDWASSFLRAWMNEKQVEYINATMRSIRKVQMDCETVAKCYAHPEWMQHPHQGIIFDRIQKTDASYSYMVYLQEHKILTRIHSIKKVENYTLHLFVLTISPIDHVIRIGFVDIL